MMDFCVNLFTVDANFEMGPRWIFFYWWSIFYWWLLISRELVFIFHKITYAWFAMAERRRERVCEREKEREREEIISLKKTSSGKIFKVFFKISSLFPYEMFSWPKLFIPDEKISLPKILSNKHDFRRHIDLCKKKL